MEGEDAGAMRFPQVLGIRHALFTRGSRNEPAYHGGVRLELYTSAFCDPCHRAREVVAEAQRLVPSLDVDERDVAAHQERAADLGIRSTPTTIIYDADGGEYLRAEGVPTLPRLLTALAAVAD